MARKRNTGIPTNISGARQVQRKVALGQPVPMSHMRATISLLTTELKNMTMQAKQLNEMVEFLKEQIERLSR